jgi:hypothetical protein
MYACPNSMVVSEPPAWPRACVGHDVCLFLNGLWTFDGMFPAVGPTRRHLWKSLLLLAPPMQVPGTACYHAYDGSVYA